MVTEPALGSSETSHPWISRSLLLQGIPLAVYLLSAACCVWYGNLNADEGWILNAARQAMQGLVPHRDFAYTQGPLQPYLYGALLTPFGVNILAGRVLTALLGLGALLLSMRLAGHLSRSPVGAMLAGLFLAVNFNATYHNTITKTHALVALLVMGAVYLAVRHGRRGALWAFLTLTVAALAVGTRLAALPVFVLLLTWMWWRGHDRRGLVAGVALAVLLGAGWTIAVGADRLWFSLVSYHLPDPMAAYAPTDWPAHLVDALRTIAITLCDYSPVLLPVVVALVLGRTRPGARTLTSLGDADTGAAWLAVCAGVVLFLAHLPSRGFGTLYMSMSLPVLACGAAVIDLRLWAWAEDRGRGMGALLAIAMGGLLLFAGAFPSLDTARVTCSLSTPDLPALRQIVAYTRALVPEAKRILTFHTYLAVEVGRPVPPAYSMSIFAYQPMRSVEDCTRLGVVNDAVLVRDLADPSVAVVALTARDVQMLRSPHQVLGVLQKRWQRVRTVPDFGQWHDEMAILVPKREGGG